MLLYFAFFVFFGTYILIASEKIHKTAAALLGAMLMLLVVLPGPGHDSAAALDKLAGLFSSGEVTLPQVEQPAMTAALGDAKSYSKLDVFSRYSNFDVIFTLAGMMILVNILSGTGLFQYIAIKCAKISKGSPVRLLTLLVLATAILSAFLDNVTTVLLVAPVTLVVAAQMRVPVLPFLMAETLASNIGGTATLIGDPPNLIIGSIANLDFMAFLVNLSPFIVGLLFLYCIVLSVYYSKRMHVNAEERARIMELDARSAITDMVNLRRGGIVMLLTIIGFLLHGAVHLQPCVVAMAGATAALLVCKVDIDHALEKIEWNTLFFFMGLFVLVSGAEKAGVMDCFGHILAFTYSWHALVTILAVMWLSAIAAAVMNNVSFTAAMAAIMAVFLQNAPQFAGNPALQELMWWGLALAVCLGGNGTIVGAAANLVVAGIAEKAGVKMTFTTFLRYGLPVTVGSMIFASLYIGIRYYVTFG